MLDAQQIKKNFSCICVDEQLPSDAMLFAESLFDEDGFEDFYEKNAKEIIASTTMHMLTANTTRCAKKRNLMGVFETITLAAACDARGKDNETSAALFNEMSSSRHLIDGRESIPLHAKIDAIAHRMAKLHPQVRTDALRVAIEKLRPLMERRSVEEKCSA